MELLAPSGSKETFYTAVNSGADAIYLGGKMFSARAYASNFSFEDMKECVTYAHLRNVKVYVTVNTLLFENEIEECLKQCEEYINIGVDAFIVQDIGLISLLKRAFPTFPLHASTQLNVHNVEQAAQLKKMGVSRVVVARECSIEDVREIINKTRLEVEVFVHGALCVSQSGQCLMSSFIGKRSGNRGRCAQPCRMKGKIVSLDSETEAKYFLSTKELCAIEYLQELEKIGVKSLKIEGRMKGIEYLYTTVSYYRKKLDGKQFSLDKALNDMKTIFNRDFTKGFINNESPVRLLNQNTSSHQGTVLGTVVKVYDRAFKVKLKQDLSMHDGIKIANKEDGLLVTHLKVNRKDVRLAKAGETVEIVANIKSLEVGDIVLKTRSSEIEKMANNVKNENKKIPITGYFTSSLEGVSLTLFDGDLSYTAYANESLELSKSNAMSKEILFDRLSKSDTYPFKLKHLDFDIVDNLFYPVKLLNEVRREAYLGLYNLKMESNQQHQKEEIKPLDVAHNHLTLDAICSVEKEEQLLECLKYPFTAIYVNSLAVYSKYKNTDPRIRYSYKRFGIDKVTAKDGLTQFISNRGNIMSPYGNITNSEAVATLLSMQYEKVILSYEVSFENALKLKEEFSKKYGFYPQIYYPSYGYVELMLLKSCPIATAYGKEKIHCGLCHSKQFYYQDRKGVEYPIYGNEDCTVKILSDKPLSLISKEEIRKEFGVYLAFTIEDEYSTNDVLEAYFNGAIEDYDYMEGHFYTSPE